MRRDVDNWWNPSQIGLGSATGLALPLPQQAHIHKHKHTRTHPHPHVIQLTQKRPAKRMQDYSSFQSPSLKAGILAEEVPVVPGGRIQAGLLQLSNEPD